jgi:WD40 repeat protein
MAMSLSLFHQNGSLILAAAFENGFVSVHRLEADGSWTMTYRCQAHTQPVLSIDIHPNRECFFTSAADALIAKHPIPISQREVDIGFEPNQRVVEVVDSPSTSSATGSDHKTLKEWEHALKIVNTKHSGQQNLKVRSDGKIFATAGWDSKIRIYSTKTLKELAVLSWHKVGAYAVAFSAIENPAAPASAQTPSTEQLDENTAKEFDGATLQKAEAEPQETKSLARGVGMSVKDRRLQLAKTAHWIAAGAKDGKVSLWDIY